MADKYISVDLDDSRLGVIADVISNKTCKKILNVLAEREMSESDLAKELEMPLNTVGYNTKKLEEAGLIEKVNKFFWSSKGKRMNIYRLSNKKIVISPKNVVKGVVPALIVVVIIALVIKFFVPIYGYNGIEMRSNLEVKDYGDAGGEISAPTAAADSGVEEYRTEEARGTERALIESIWLWFLIGAFCGLFVYLVWNLMRNR